MERIFKSSLLKNKVRKQMLYNVEKKKRRKERKLGREERAKRRKLLGEDACPKEIPKTIENCRIVDETVVSPEDQEGIQDGECDEFAAYFTGSVTPKVLITSSNRPSLKSHLLMRELAKCIPNSHIKLRNGIDLKRAIPSAESRGYTAVIVVNEDRKLPNGMLIVQLPEGPSAHFKVSSFKRGYDIKGHGRPTNHQPEIILNNFSTKLGHTVGRLFASLFPHQPQFKGRQVITFHNQRDYIFFRHHRYIFKGSKRVGMQELGPKFTLKLRSLQKGTFDSKYGEYLWLQEKESNKSRRKFYL